MANKDFSLLQRNTIWKKYFGDKNSGKDVFGREIKKNNFERDHIYPKAKGGKTNIKNGIPLNPLSNEEKSDNLSGKVNKQSFKVYGKKEQGILIVNNVVVSK